MAERRMFSRKVVCSDDFTEMPAMSQLLYFQLGMEADDDGFLDCQRRVRLSIGATEEDLLLLVQKGYIIQFDNVLCITHWRMSNRVRGDRRKETVYRDLKALLEENNNIYVLKCDDNQLTTNWQPTDNQVATKWQPSGNLGEYRLDESRLVESSLGQSSAGKAEALACELGLTPSFFPKINDWFSHKEEKSGEQTEGAMKALLKVIKKNIDQYGEEAVAELIDYSITHNYGSLYFDRLEPKKDENATSDLDYGNPEDFYK